MSSTETEAAEAVASIDLDPVLDIRAAAPLHRELMERRGTPLRLDGRNVERIGGQCAAILLSAARSWAGDGVPLVLDEPSEGLCEGLRTLGLDASSIAGAETELA